MSKRQADTDMIDLDREPLDAENEEENLSEEDSVKKFKPNYHLIILALIVLILAFSIYRLVKWNRGTVLPDIDPNADTSEFDIETLDMIIPIDSSRLEGHTDDGETTILCLGNNPFTDSRSDDGLAAMIARKTGATVYNCAFPDSSAACKYAVYNPEYTRDHFNLYYVVECFRNNEFKAIRSIASYEPDPRHMEVVSEMQEVDMEKVDFIIIMYDSTDYLQGTPSDNPDNNYDVTAFTGGLRTTIKNIQDTWPYIRVFVMSPTYALYQDADGNQYNGTLKDIGHGTLNHYVVKEAEACMNCGASFIDNYFGTINEDNYQDYMRDYLHCNEAGRELLADRISVEINKITGYDAD